MWQNAFPVFHPLTRNLAGKVGRLCSSPPQLSPLKDGLAHIILQGCSSIFLHRCHKYLDSLNVHQSFKFLFKAALTNNFTSTTDVMKTTCV